MTLISVLQSFHYNCYHRGCCSPCSSRVGHCCDSKQTPSGKKKTFVVNVGNGLQTEFLGIGSNAAREVRVAAETSNGIDCKHNESFSNELDHS